MTAATLTLTDFLLARIAEDEAAARAVLADMPRWDSSSWEEACLEVGGGLPGPALSARMSPARVLAECEAKRQIVEECRALINSFGDWDAEVGAPALWTDVNRRERSQAHGRLYTLAAVYADHPDYREEWRP